MSDPIDANRKFIVFCWFRAIHFLFFARNLGNIPTNFMILSVIQLSAFVWTTSTSDSTSLILTRSRWATRSLRPEKFHPKLVYRCPHSVSGYLSHFVMALDTRGKDYFDLFTLATVDCSVEAAAAVATSVNWDGPPGSCSRPSASSGMSANAVWAILIPGPLD